MKHDLVSRLRCPITGAALRLQSFETETLDGAGDGVVITKEGILLSETHKIWYPITNYVPVLLTFRTAFHDRFYARHLDRFVEYNDYRMPDGSCERGEDFIQQSFTEEWNLTQDSALSFVRTDEDLVNLNRHVWLHWIAPEERFDRVLNVGCGIGKETMALRDVVRAKEIFAVDLNFALLEAGSRYRAVPDVHFVICSLFHLPFAKESFDLVYSQGVIHHTWSTYEAFKRLADFTRPEGYLFVWVYALDDHLVHRNSAWTSSRAMVKHVLSVGLFGLESMVRPWLSRSPSWLRRGVIFLLSTGLHPFIGRRVIHRALWKPANTRHSLRDLLTPVYAFRHDMNEVVGWYEELGFRIVGVQSPTAHKRLFSGKRIHGIGLTGRRRMA